MRLRVILAFSAIFIIWGSTYLAIRYAVAEIPPFLTAGVRHLTAGSVLYVWARAQGYRATLGTAAVLVGAASWGAGVVYSRHAQLPDNATLRTATTLLCGAVLLLGASTAFGEYHRVHVPTALAIGSLAYLIVFGSIVSFT